MKQGTVFSIMGFLVFTATFSALFAGCAHRSGFYAGRYEGTLKIEVGPQHPIKFAVDENGSIGGNLDIGSLIQLTGNIDGKGNLRLAGSGITVTGKISENKANGNIAGPQNVIPNGSTTWTATKQ